MGPNDIALKMVEVLSRAKIPFMIVGSFSSNVYGIERNTQDADFVIDLDPDHLQQPTSELGGDFKLNPQLTFEGIVAMGQFYVVNHLDPLFKIELFLAGGDPHSAAHFKRARKVRFQGHDLRFIGPEDLIVTKLRWFNADRRRTKDFDDVRGVLAVQLGKLDMQLIQRDCQEQGTLSS